MISATVPRGTLIDVTMPAAGAPHRGASSRRALLPDLVLLVAGAALTALCLWLDARSLAHQSTVLAGAVQLDARTLTGDSILAAAGAALIALSARLEWRALARETGLVLAGVLLLALGAHVRIPLQPVPVTGQTFAVLLIAAALGWRRGLTAVTLYIALGTAGAPVFADVSTPVTYGYLAGFALAAVVVGWLAERGWDRRLRTAVPAMLLGEVAIYACGLPWLAQYVGWSNAIAFGLVPFVVGDVAKLLAAALVLPAAWRVTGRALSRRMQP